MHVTKSISLGKDQNGVCKVFKDYFEGVKVYLNTKCALTSKLCKKDQEGVFGKIYDYAMIKIHELIFPKELSSCDIQINSQIEILSPLTPEQFKTKQENFNPAIASLFTKGNNKVERCRFEEGREVSDTKE